LPDPELFKTSIDIFSIHVGFISQIKLFFNVVQKMPNIPVFQYSIIPLFQL